MSPPKVSVITVISGNDIAFLGDCLHSLITVTRYEPIEYIAVCDADPPMQAFLSNYMHTHPQLRVVNRTGKHGNASNRNYGALEASSDSSYLLFCDSDVLFSNPRWLHTLATILEEHPSVGLVGSNNGTALGHFCWIDPVSGLLINNVMDFAGALPDQPVEMMVIPGCCMLIRRSLFAEIGGWDEGFFPVYGEDIDLCLRCIAAGARVFSQHDPGVIHLYRDTGRNNSCERLPDDRRLWLTVASCRRLALKYSGILPTAPADGYNSWLLTLTSLRGCGQEQLSNRLLPPTVVDNRLNQLYVPLQDHEHIAALYASILFDY